MTAPIRVLVAGHDWGGLNLLAPLLRSWIEDLRIQPEFLAAPIIRRDFSHRVPGLAIVPGAEDLTEWVCNRPLELDHYLADLLERGRYDVVLCGTSAHALLERRLLLAAEQSGIPSIAFCDMWFAYAERFHDGNIWMLPARLWVIDEAMRAAVQEIEWPRSLPTDVIGSPLFGELASRRASRNNTGRAIRFVSEPASTKFPQARINEFELADMLVSAARSAGIVFPIVIRPHPIDPVEAWRHWVFARRHQGVELETLPSDEAMKDTRLAVGISSIMLGEMRMCGIPVASLQRTDADPAYFCLPFEELGIVRVSDQTTLANWLTTPGEEEPPAAAQLHRHAVDAATRSLLALASEVVVS